MKKCNLYALLLIFSGVMLFNACLPGSKKNSNENTSDTEQTISSEDGLFSINIPKGWEQLNNNELNDEADIQAQKRYGDHYVAILAENKEDLDYTYEEWQESVFENYVAELENVTVSDPIDIVIDGQPAKQVEIKGSVDRIKIALLATYVNGEKYFAQVLTWTTPSKYKASIEEFKEITNSIKGLN